MGVGTRPSPPLVLGDSPTGMTRGGLRKGLYLLLPGRAAVIPSGESPDGTGESPVLPMLFFEGLLTMQGESSKVLAPLSTGWPCDFYRQ
jgi:hypothetical protein